MNKNLLEILVCPICKGKLIYRDSKAELICAFDRIAFPIRNNIPVMLTTEGRLLTSEEVESIKSNATG